MIDEELVQPSFSMCLGSNGGVFILGGVDTSYNDAEMQYTDIVDDTYYVVQVNDFSVGETSIGLDMSEYSGTIVDSGTTLLVLSPDVWNAFVYTYQNDYCPDLPSDLQSSCSGSDSIFTGSGFNFQESDIESFPSISINLESIGYLELDPAYYFISYNGYYYLGITEGNFTGMIIGDVFMQAYNIHFDRGNNRLGFAPVGDCEGSDTSIAISSGNGQAVNVGSHSTPLTVQVTYTDDSSAASNLLIQFSVASGDATVEAPFGITDATGYASTTISPTSGGSVSITALVMNTNNEVKFSLTASDALSVRPAGVLVLLTVALCLLAGML